MKEKEYLLNMPLQFDKGIIVKEAFVQFINEMFAENGWLPLPAYVFQEISSEKRGRCTAMPTHGEFVYIITHNPRVEIDRIKFDARHNMDLYLIGFCFWDAQSAAQEIEALKARQIERINR